MLTRIIGTVIALAGVNVLCPVRRAATAPAGDRERRHCCFAVGAAAGFGSGLTGAGGPLFSVPIMLALGFAPLLTIGVSQVLQIISAASGTPANLRYGSDRFPASRCGSCRSSSSASRSALPPPIAPT